MFSKKMQCFSEKACSKQSYNYISNHSKLNFNLDFEVARLRDFEVSRLQDFEMSSIPETSWSRILAISLSRDLDASFSICKLILLTYLQYLLSLQLLLELFRCVISRCQTAFSCFVPCGFARLRALRSRPPRWAGISGFRS